MEGIQIYTSQGHVSGMMDLNLEILKREISSKAYSCSIRALVQNWRQGTVGCKDRSEVAFSGKKPWKQKGTGRARVGSISSPLWRKGGIIFGPQPRTRTLKVSRKQLSGVLNNLFFQKLDSNSIVCLDFEETIVPKTKVVYSPLKKLGLTEHKNVVLFLDYSDSVNFAAFRNIPNISILFFDNPNAFDLSNAAKWVFLKKDFESFRNMVSKWN